MSHQKIEHPTPGPDCLPVDQIPFLIARGELTDTLSQSPAFSLAPAPEDATNLSAAWFQVMRLKRLFRRGWLRVGIPEERCESVAEHSSGVAFLCLIHAQSQGVKAPHAALMALVHELGEVHTGDLTPHDHVPKAEKHRREEEAINLILKELDTVTAAHMRGLWEEYEAQASPEARFVKQMDFLEMGTQAAVYMAEGFPDALELLESARRGLKGSPFSRFLHPKD